MAGYVVTGAAVVLRTRARTGGGEQYLYRGAPIVEGVFLADSIRHAESLGLIAPVPDPSPTAEEQAAAKAAADKAAADAAAKAATSATGAKTESK